MSNTITPTISNTITPTVFYRMLNVEGLEIFYREAGPRELAPLALQNKRLIYNLLFHASAETLLEIARDPPPPRKRSGRPTSCRKSQSVVLNR